MTEMKPENDIFYWGKIKKNLWRKPMFDCDAMLIGWEFTNSKMIGDDTIYFRKLIPSNQSLKEAEDQFNAEVKMRNFR